MTKNKKVFFLVITFIVVVIVTFVSFRLHNDAKNQTPRFHGVRRQAGNYDIAQVQNEYGYWGLINAVTMEEILPKKYLQIWDIIDGFVNVRLDDQQEVVIELATAEIISSHAGFSLYLGNDLILASDDDTYSIIQLSTQTEIIPFGRYEFIFTNNTNEVARIITAESEGLIDMVTWEVIIPVGEFKRVEDIGDGMARVTTHEGLSGIIDIETRAELIPFTRELGFVRNFGNGLIVLRNELFAGAGESLINIFTGETIIDHDPLLNWMSYHYGVIRVTRGGGRGGIMYAGERGAFKATTGEMLIPFGANHVINIISPERAIVMQEEGAALLDFVNQTYLIPFGRYTSLNQLPFSFAGITQDGFIAQAMDGAWYLLEIETQTKIRINGDFENIIPFANNVIAIQEIHRDQLFWRFEQIENLITQ